MNANQNLRVIARRLNLTLDEKYLSVLKSKIKMEDSFWESRSGSMLLATANVFFNKGVKGQRAFLLGKIASTAFYEINHAQVVTPNVLTLVHNAAKENGNAITVTAGELTDITELLVGYFAARDKEKSRPNITNVVLRKARGY